MHPIIQLTVAVAMVVMAARMWPPILYWLAGLFMFLAAIKFTRRSIRWLRKVMPSDGFSFLLRALLACSAWIAIAAIADYALPAKVSAMSILLCFMAACLSIELGVVLIGLWKRFFRHRRQPYR